MKKFFVMIAHGPLLIAFSSLTARATDPCFWPGLHSNDEVALTAIYEKLGGSGWANQTGWFDDGKEEPALAMINVQCAPGNGRVESFTFGATGLNDGMAGIIPGAVSGLAGLKFFSIKSQPGVSGSLPSSLGSISTLESIVCSGTNLSGTLAISGGSSLRTLAVENPVGFGLSGPIPESIGTLGRLQDLGLQGNSLSGTVPASLFTLPSLETIDVSNNLITGVPAVAGATLPKSINLDNNCLDLTDGETLNNIAALRAMGVVVNVGTQKPIVPIRADHFIDEVVDNSAGKRSLREAVALAVERANTIGVGVPVLLPAGSYELTMGAITVGPTGGRLVGLVPEGGRPTISGPANRLFFSNGATLSANGVDFQGGAAGFLIAGGQFTAVNCKFVGGEGFDGGAVLASGGAECVFEDCAFISNSAVEVGGAIAAEGDGKLKIKRCLFSGNSCAGDEASRQGGAIYTEVECEVEDSTFLVNIASGGSGGAIYAKNAVLDVAGCLFWLNLATHGGGAICLGEANPGLARAANTTFFENITEFGGGAISILGTSVDWITEFNHCSFVGNASRAGHAGGIDNSAGRASILLDHTILADNLAGAVNRNGAGRIRSVGGYNLIGNDFGMDFDALQSDIVGTSANIIDPKVGGIVGNALAILPFSPAWNAGDPRESADRFPLQDGRGAARVRDRRIDIGAYELEFTFENLIAAYTGLEFFDENPEAVAPGADLNGNGLPNIIDVAFGNNPAQAEPGAKVPAPIVGSLIVEFPLDERLRSLSYGVRGSSDLAEWQAGAIYHPLGAGAGYLRLDGAASEFVSATQDGSIWTIRERIVLGPGSEEAQFADVVVRDGQAPPGGEWQEVYSEDFEAIAPGFKLPAGWTGSQGNSGFAGTVDFGPSPGNGNPGQSLRLFADTAAGSDAEGDNYFITINSATIDGPLSETNLAKLRLLADLRGTDLANTQSLRIESSIDANFSSVSGRVQFTVNTSGEFTEVGGLLSEGTVVSNFNPEDPFLRIRIVLNHNNWGFDDGNFADWDNVRLEAQD